jgi:TolB-like protein
VWPGAALPADSGRERSIAVLPFENVGGHPDEEYFSDGLSEELIAALSQLRSLRVAARTSAFAFKGHSRDVREIGRALNVGAVLVGSVRRQGGRVRITAQLIDAADGLGLWSEAYDEKALSEIFDIQADLALRIARSATEERLVELHTQPKEEPARGGIHAEDVIEIAIGEPGDVVANREPGILHEQDADLGAERLAETFVGSTPHDARQPADIHAARHVIAGTS